ncbi:tRNA 4-thiouridine(8) synthase ThiI [Candidatus Thorarchaeota archaeon]|nr:MAG: tRNA 4-thiouridine(8) synthase ThiI [Candidatus Thorarchaeota archaeon]
MTPEYSTVIVRFGEIGIKSPQTRKRMVGLLMKHIRTALNEHEVEFSEVRREFGRVFIETSNADRATVVASRIFGVVSTSPAVRISSRLSDILSVGVELAREHFEPRRSFAIRARRFGEHDYSSQDIGEQLGSDVMTSLEGLCLTVDLDTPEQTLSVEVRKDDAYLFVETVGGAGGMPTGSQGRVVCTISSGLDSPVAAYKVMKRGCVPVFVNFDNSPHMEGECNDIALRQAKVLAQYIYNYEVKMYIVPHGRDLTDILENTPEKMTCLFCKRNMLRLAQEVATAEDADAIVTGDIIGEQASQTSRNLRVVSDAICDYPVLRPLVGDDKVDVEHLARQIGTYRFAREATSCCTLPPRYPSVEADLERVKRAEEPLDLSVLKDEIADARVIFLREGT